MVLRLRQVEKIAHIFESMHRFSNHFFIKIDEKTSPKVRKTLSVTKIDKTSLPGTPFGAKDRFLVEFGRPARSPKNAKSCQSGEKL